MFLGFTPKYWLNYWQICQLLFLCYQASFDIPSATNQPIIVDLDFNTEFIVVISLNSLQPSTSVGCKHPKTFFTSFCILVFYVKMLPLSRSPLNFWLKYTTHFIWISYLVSAQIIKKKLNINTTFKISIFFILFQDCFLLNKIPFSTDIYSVHVCFKCRFSTVHCFSTFFELFPFGRI